MTDKKKKEEFLKPRIFNLEDKIQFTDLSPSLQDLFKVMSINAILGPNIETASHGEDLKVHISDYTLFCDYDFHLCKKEGNKLIVDINDNNKYEEFQILFSKKVNNKIPQRIFVYELDKTTLWFYKDPDHLIKLFPTGQTAVTGPFLTKIPYIFGQITVFDPNKIVTSDIQGTMNVYVDPCMFQCQTGCQVSCQSGCQVSCQSGCQVSCQSGCEVSCQSGCQVSCQTGCEVSCQSGCQVSCQTGCEVYRQCRDCADCFDCCPDCMKNEGAKMG